MKTKFFTFIFFLALFQSCINEFQEDSAEVVTYITDDITTLVVPEGHDLRPITLQNTSIALSQDSRADIVKIKIFKIENDIYKLLYNGAIDRTKSINNLIKVPNHTSLLSVQAELATGTREWLVTPNELENLIIEDEITDDSDESKSSTSAKTSGSSSNDSPPTWNCGDYSEFNGNDNGNFQITTNSTQSLTVNKNTSIYICSGGSWSPSSFSDWGSKLTIYVASGGSLSLNGALYPTIYNEGTFNGVNTIFRNKSEFNNWGTMNINGNLGVFSDEINIYGGTCNISGSLQIEGHFDNDGGTVNVGGSVTISDKLHNKEGSTLTVGGNFTVNSGEFKNECKTIVSGNFTNNKKVEFKNASYTAINGYFLSNPGNDVKIIEGSIFKCASITSGGNIKGDKGYSIIETGSITFWSSSKKFKGELDICSNSYTGSMGDNKVISSCDTFISSSACSLGYNNVIDNDNDGAIAGVDVDDNNPNVASYNFPQGQNTFFTSVYEDLYPCMGDYDLNDLVNNYSYQEGINNGDSNNGQNTSITEIKFDYKFPAIGAGYNNSFVLRVMDGDNNAILNLESSDRYAASEITRRHDTQNNTTLFTFNNIKSMYTSNPGAIVNTVKVDYADIPVISGTVSNINGAYDEFILKGGESGQEIHPLYNELHINYPALNAASIYNDANNFLKCDDNSTGTNLFVNANGFPWVLTDLPMDLPWPKEGVSILEAYPNFDDFVTSDSSLDWYSNNNGNRVNAKLINN
jgi:LruC domain-containing protein